jgi:hypothetical protein
MKTIVKLTDRNNNIILVGVESIIDVTTITTNELTKLTKIQSRGAMVTTNYVIETVEEIYSIINS